jgi:hypothetical protein
MPVVTGEATFPGSKTAELLPLDRLSLRLKDSAPEFFKRVILTGQVLFLIFFADSE